MGHYKDFMGTLSECILPCISFKQTKNRGITVGCVKIMFQADKKSRDDRKVCQNNASSRQNNRGITVRCVKITLQADKQSRDYRKQYQNHVSSRPKIAGLLKVCQHQDKQTKNRGITTRCVKNHVSSTPKVAGSVQGV